MTTFSLAAARCASTLIFTLTTALPTVAADGGTRETCPKVATDTTASGAEVQSQLMVVDIVFVTASSKKPGLADQAPDEEWANWKLDDISRFVAERAPKVMRTNGLDGKVIVLAAPQPGDTPDFSQLDSSRPAVVFAPTQFTKWRPKPLSSMAGSLFYSVRLINAGVNAPEMKCRVEVWGGVGFDSTWGAFKTNRVDSEWVDTRVTDGLTMMAKYGLVKLNGDKAIRPTE
jgi:hypothetical protein